MLTVVADAGYSNLTQFQAREDAAVTAYVPPNRARNTQGMARCSTVPASAMTPSVTTIYLQTASVSRSSNSTLTITTVSQTNA